ncbi:CBS domain-containing protein [Paraburkholderia sp. BR10872]|uniref:CBS domain-containing protein n=1 Tax=Paraburkholderia sp. BR10872 TaxID=3236989 RepID=UPI0034D1C0EC
MRAIDVMTSHVVVASPDMNVQTAAKLLDDNRISGMPVVNSTGQVVGMLSEGDLVRRTEIGTGERRRSWWLELFTSNRKLASEYVKEHAHTVMDIMSQPVVSVSEDTPLHLLERHRVKRVPVLRDDKLVGIVSRSNLIRALATVTPVKLATSSSDREIREAVLRELSKRRWALPRHGVLVQDGVVHFWGVVQSEDERTAIRAAVEGVPGIKGIGDHLYLPIGEVPISI